MKVDIFFDCQNYPIPGTVGKLEGHKVKLNQAKFRWITLLTHFAIPDVRADIVSLWSAVISLNQRSFPYHTTDKLFLLSTLTQPGRVAMEIEFIRRSSSYESVCLQCKEVLERNVKYILVWSILYTFCSIVASKDLKQSAMTLL